MVERGNRLFSIGCGLLIGFALVAALAPLIAPYDPLLPSGRPLGPPTRAHLLGTNDLGQDVLSQLLHGTRTSLLVAGLVTLISTVLSWLVGLLSGFPAGRNYRSWP